MQSARCHGCRSLLSEVWNYTRAKMDRSEKHYFRLMRSTLFLGKFETTYLAVLTAAREQGVIKVYPIECYVQRQQFKFLWKILQAFLTGKKCPKSATFDQLLPLRNEVPLFRKVSWAMYFYCNLHESMSFDRYCKGRPQLYYHSSLNPGDCRPPSAAPAAGSSEHTITEGLRLLPCGECTT